MFPLTIRHSKLKPLIAPFILLVILVILCFTGAGFFGLLVLSIFFIVFTIMGVTSFKENIVMYSAKICFCEGAKEMKSINYFEINKLDLYNEVSTKHSTTYMYIYENGKCLEDNRIDFSGFRKADIRKIVELILKQNPKVNITPKLTKKL